MISLCYKRYTGRNRFFRNLTPFPVCDSGKYRSASFHFYSLYLASLIVFLTFFSAVCAAEEPQFYTIQAGSYAGEQGASHLYQNLVDILPESQRLYLRVEKVGNYFTVRVGKFDARKDAVDYRHRAGESLAGGSILQAYIRDERILRIYQPVSETSLALEAEQAAVFTEQALPVGAELSSVETGKIAEPKNDTDRDAHSVSLENASGASLAGAEEEEKAWEKLDQEIIIENSIPEPLPAKMSDTGPVALFDSAASEPVVTVEADFPANELLQEAETQPQSPNAEASIAELSGADVDGKKAISYEKPGQPDGILPVRVVKVLSQGIFGHKILYPSSIGYDRHMDETYLISGGGQHPSGNIIVYGPDYFPVAALGDGRKVFSPRALEFDSEGNIYMIQAKSDGKPHRLSIFNAAFFLRKEIFIDESIPDIPEGFYPNNIALSDGKIYITGNNNNGVLVLDRQYNFQGWLSPQGTGSQEEVGNDPGDPRAITVIDVATDRNGRVYLLSSDAGRVYVLDKDHKFLFGFGSKGGSTGMLSRPQSLAVDEVRQVIYLVDYMRHAVNVYNYKNGRFIFEIGGRGLSPGWFQYPTHIEVDRKSNLIVADYLNHRVQVLYVQ